MIMTIIYMIHNGDEINEMDNGLLIKSNITRKFKKKIVVAFDTVKV